MSAQISGHLGNVVFDSLRENPDVICQIDASTGEEETRRSVLSRSIRLARAMRKCDLKPGDVLALSGKNHLDVHIPYYAAVMNGYPIAGIDPFFKFDEIKDILKIIEPKIVFCEFEAAENYKRARKELGLGFKLVTFKKGECTLSTFVENNDDNQPEDQFEVATLDLAKTYGFLVPTSGTTGQLKVVAITHLTISFLMPYLRVQRSETPQNALNLSGIQWGSALGNATIMLYINQIRIQTSAPCTTEHVIDIINKYKPVTTTTTPTLLSRILKHDKKCDLTCFDSIVFIGSSVSKDLLTELRKHTKHPYVVMESYGLTEGCGSVLLPAPQGPLGNCGKPYQRNPCKLVDQVTGKLITEPNRPGELWIKGILFSEYYKNPDETKNAFSEDGWFKTGDLMYRDEHDYYYFVDRIKMLIKYRLYHVSPTELEEIIRQHEDVVNVCVSSFPDPDDGERAVACVVKRPGAVITEQEIKDLVANKLSIHKQLYGGVLFVDDIPMTSVGKIARGKVRELVMQHFSSI